MGKKKITNKFAAVKRMISTQDQRMYECIDLEKPTSRNTRNMKKKGGS